MASRHQLAKIGYMAVDIAIIGNCQSAPLARVLAGQPGLNVKYHLDINNKGGPLFTEQVPLIIAEAREGRLAVVTHPLKTSFGELSSANLQQLPVVRTYTNIYFEGLHPDITVLGAFQARLRSPIGDYHSSIVVGAWLQGLNVADCLGRFNHVTYEKLGYYKKFSDSANKLLDRESAVDIRFVSEFIGMLRTTPSLYTVNHPTMEVITAQARGICAAFGLTPSLFPGSFHYSPLASAAWWPIYPEFAEAHGIVYETPFLFKRSTADGKMVYFALEAFVQASYRFLDMSGQEKIRSCVQVPGILAAQAGL